jgi:2-haloacid dehalogenase
VQLDALLFDVFGTLVDWRSSLIADLSALGKERGVDADWSVLVDTWRSAYVPSMNAVRSGALPWTPLDGLHRASFDALCEQFGIADALDEEARRWCVDRWHHLRPWPDTLAGLTRLRARYILATLSNGNVRLLVDLAKNAPLPVDTIFSAEIFRHYKPDPQTYLGAVELLATTPERVMLVAAHNSDLLAAKSHGLRTAWIARPTEYGPKAADTAAADGVDISAANLTDLADLLGAS